MGEEGARKARDEGRRPGVAAGALPFWKIEARLAHVAEVALETVQAAVEQGDVRAALAVLKGLGASSGAQPEIGPDDPAELAEEKRVAEGQHAMRRQLAPSATLRVERRRAGKRGRPRPGMMAPGSASAVPVAWSRTLS